MKSVCSLMLIVLSIGLFSSAVFAQDAGVRDTCRIGEYTWTISSDADSLFEFQVWGWTDATGAMTAASLGFRMIVDTTGFDLDRWDTLGVSFGGVNFFVSAIDSLIIFGDTTRWGPSMTANIEARSYSQLDTTKWAAGIAVGFINHGRIDTKSNLFAIGPVALGVPIMPSNQQNVMATVTLLLRDPTKAPNDFTIVIDSTFIPPAQTFKFSVTGSPGYAPEFVKGQIHVSNLVLDADDPEVDDPVLPKSYELAQNYPNPFNPSTTLKFYNAQKSHVNLTIYNIMGQRVRTLVDADMDIGWQEVIWDGADSQGEQVSSGLYFYKMDANDFTETKKMLLVK